MQLVMGLLKLADVLRVLLRDVHIREVTRSRVCKISESIWSLRRPISRFMNMVAHSQPLSHRHMTTAMVISLACFASLLSEATSEPHISQAYSHLGKYIEPKFKRCASMPLWCCL